MCRGSGLTSRGCSAKESRVFSDPKVFFSGSFVSGGGPETEVFMDNFTFGVTMLVCGMGGTIVALWILSLIMELLGRMFPVKPEKKEA